MAPKKRRCNRKRHHWTLRETKIYLNYLQNHKELFVDFRTRKSNKVFVSISKLLKTRKSHQVKSHHQKLMEKHGSIPEIIAFLREFQEVFDDSPSTNPSENSVLTPEVQTSRAIWEIDSLDLFQSEENGNIF